MLFFMGKRKRQLEQRPVYTPKYAGMRQDEIRASKTKLKGQALIDKIQYKL